MKILARILPHGSQVTVADTCGEFFGGAVGLFTDVHLPSEKSLLNHEPDGRWFRSASLLDFVTDDDHKYTGAGVSATILDGKKCLGEKTERAREILFEENPGLYFRSRNRQIVAIIFDEPKGQGVLFLQAP